jgi:hypothetical protein
MILKLLPNVGGNVNVDVTVSGENGTAVSGKTGVSTSFSIPSLNLKFVLKNDNSYSVCGTGVCTDSQITIPSTYNGAPVTSIEPHEFSDCYDLTAIVIPDSVTSIAERAFDGCGALTEITVHENNTHYRSENGVLFNKEKTELLRYPEGKTETTYSIPDSVTEIGKWAFYCCRNLTDMTIPGNVTCVEVGAFSACYDLTTIVIPESVTSIGYDAFGGCSSLTSMTLPFVGNTADGTSNTHFGYIFGAISYSDHSLETPSSLQTVVITGGSRIDSFAFYGCGSLTGIVIPDGVTSIGSSAFNSCMNLMSVTVGVGVKAIGDYAFNGCDNLTSVQFGGTVAQWKAISFGSYWDYDTGNYSVTCTDGTVSKN